MNDNANGWEFKRGLDLPLMGQLEALAKEPGWFADVLADEDLILGIRDNYLNVYWRGQSLFKITSQGGSAPLRVSTHPKYLINPELSGQVRFDGERFFVEEIKDPFADGYQHGITLNRMKRAADLYCGDEKKGVHAIATRNENVIDTEIAFRNCGASAEDEPTVPRIDLACFEEVEDSIRLRFWEAKLYSNQDLRAEGDKEAPVVRQVGHYCDLIGKHRHEVIRSYRTIACNLVEIARWVHPHRNVGQLVQRVAGGAPIDIDNPAMVGLVVYGYDSDQKCGKHWDRHMGKLRTALTTVPAGDPKHIKLRAGNRHPVAV